MFYIAAHGGALVCLLLAGVHLLFSLLASVILTIHCFYVTKRYTLLKHPKSVVQIKLSDIDAQVAFKNETRVLVGLNNASLSWKILTILRFDEGKKTYNVPLCLGMMDKDEYRHLRVRLRIEKTTTEGTENTELKNV